MARKGRDGLTSKERNAIISRGRLARLDGYSSVNGAKCPHEPASVMAMWWDAGVQARVNELTTPPVIPVTPDGHSTFIMW